MARTSSAQFLFASLVAAMLFVSCGGIESSPRGTGGLKDASTAGSGASAGSAGSSQPSEGSSGGDSAGSIGGGGPSSGGGLIDDGGCVPGPPWNCHVSRTCDGGGHTTLTGKV